MAGRGPAQTIRLRVRSRRRPAAARRPPMDDDLEAPQRKTRGSRRHRGVLVPNVAMVLRGANYASSRGMCCAEIRAEPARVGMPHWRRGR